MLNSYLVQLEKSWKSALILRQQRARGPQAALELQGQFICGWWSRIAPGCTAPAPSVSLWHSGPAMSRQQREMFIPPPGQERFPHAQGNFCLPVFGSFWLVFSEGLWGSWKPLCLKLEILETLFLFISVWLISIYGLCNVLPCGSLEFGMWTRPWFPGRKWFLQAQCREVTLACSEQSLRNSFNREKTWHMAD